MNLGLGNYVGARLAGETLHYFTSTATGGAPLHDWRVVWLIPAAGAAAVMIATALVFRGSLGSQNTGRADRPAAPETPPTSPHCRRPKRDRGWHVPERSEGRATQLSDLFFYGPLVPRRAAVLAGRLARSAAEDAGHVFHLMEARPAGDLFDGHIRAPQQFASDLDPHPLELLADRAAHFLLETLGQCRPRGGNLADNISGEIPSLACSWISRAAEATSGLSIARMSVERRVMTREGATKMGLAGGVSPSMSRSNRAPAR